MKHFLPSGLFVICEYVVNSLSWAASWLLLFILSSTFSSILCSGYNLSRTSSLNVYNQICFGNFWIEKLQCILHVSALEDYLEGKLVQKTAVQLGCPHNATPFRGALFNRYKSKCWLWFLKPYLRDCLFPVVSDLTQVLWGGGPYSRKILSGLPNVALHFSLPPSECPLSFQATAIKTWLIQEGNFREWHADALPAPVVFCRYINM